MRRIGSETRRHALSGAMVVAVCFVSCTSSTAIENASAWEFSLDGFVGDAAADTQAVYFGASDGSVYALEPRLGTTLWQRPVELNVFSRPVIRDESILIAGSTGVPFQPDTYGPAEVLSMQRSNGQIVWRFQMEGTFQAKVYAYGDRAVASVGPHVYCLDAKTGTVRWKYKHRTGLVMGIAQDERLIVVQGADGRIASFDAANGAEVWTASARARVYFRPIVAHGFLYTGNINGELIAFHVGSGEEAWTVKTGSGLEGSGAIINDVLLFTNRNAEVYGVNAHTGDQRWQRSYPVVGEKTSQFGGVDAAGNRFAFSCVENGIWVLSAETGEELQHVPVDSRMSFVTLSDTHVMHSPIGRGNLAAVSLTL